MPCARDRGHRGVDVGDAVGELLEAGPGAVEELRDRRVGVSGASSWRRGVGVADRQHRLADALGLVDLFVHDLEAEVLGVEGHGLVEIGDGDADMVDRRDQVGWQHRSIVAGSAASGHRLTASSGVRFSTAAALIAWFRRSAAAG